MSTIAIRPERMPGRTRRSAVRLASVLLFIPGSALHAQQIYKSVDADGHVVYTDQASPSATPTTIVAPPDAPARPDLIRFCWTNCFTLKADDGSYRRTDGTEETWTVERFGSDSVVLHRHDAPAAWNGNSTDVVYQGRVVDGQLLDVTVNGAPVPAIRMSWGAALDSLPGSNAERDQRHWTPSQAQVLAPVAPQAPGGTPGAALQTSTAPPPLQDEVQAPDEEDGDLWTPGYWAWGGVRYYWVPGVWVRPPRIGLLWTPGYWSYAAGFYTFNSGYWGPQVGYYGGINYGYGYFGTGYSGGRWVGNAFAYNLSASRVNASVVHNTYDEPVPDAARTGRVSYNGGPGGTTATPTAQEQVLAAQARVPATLQQRQHAQRAAPAPVPLAHGNAGHTGDVAAAKSRPARPVATAKASPKLAQVPAGADTRGAIAPDSAAPSTTTVSKPVAEKAVAHHEVARGAHP